MLEGGASRRATPVVVFFLKVSAHELEFWAISGEKGTRQMQRVRTRHYNSVLTGRGGLVRHLDCLQPSVRQTAWDGVFLRRRAR